MALVAAHVLSGKGEHGFDDKHRGQLIVVTGKHPYPALSHEWFLKAIGPLLMAGKELAEAAKQALETEIEFEPISQYARLSSPA